MAIFIEKGQGKYLVEGEERELRFTVVKLPEGYKAPEGSSIPEGTKQVLVYDFTDEKGGQMISYENMVSEGIPTPESLEGELRNTLDELDGVPEEKRRPIALRVGDKGAETYTEEMDAYKILGLDVSNDVIVSRGKAVVGQRPADWTHYEIGTGYCQERKEVVAEKAGQEVTLDSLEGIGDFRFTDEKGGQVIVFKKKYVPQGVDEPVLDDIFGVLFSLNLKGPDITEVESKSSADEMYYAVNRYMELILEMHEKGQERDIAKLLGLESSI